MNLEDQLLTFGLIVFGLLVCTLLPIILVNMEQES
jgi:hypothetical protein